jgi:FkbM family methyltransferase
MGMTLPNPAKPILKRLRRAPTATVDDRLNDIFQRLGEAASRLDLLDDWGADVDLQLGDIDQRIAELASGLAEITESQTALLQSSIHLVEAYAQNRRAQSTALATIRSSLVELSVQSRRSQDAALATVRSWLDEELRRSAAAADSVASVLPELRDYLANQSDRHICIEAPDYGSENPEVGLMAFLYSYLPTHNAIDVGAHTGEVSQYLLNAGYEVSAFEPYPPSYTRLTDRLNGQTGFKAFLVALGNETGEAPLHLAVAAPDDQWFDDPTVFHSLAPHGMPEGLTFSSTVSVPVRRLADLHREEVLPPAQDISLLKIDTEGYDLEVIRGMDDCHYPVVVVEFWDVQIPFADRGLRYTAQDMVAEMRGRGYLWYIVLYRVWGQNTLAFFCNHDRPVPKSWGNIFFFADRDTFMQAQQWCTAVLPRTFFKPAASSQPVQALANGQH